jgi:protein-S-isoprenylcysteine O-methyltransferase Ste14
MKNNEDSPQVITMPPFVFLGGIIIGFIIDLIIPAPFFSEAYDLPAGLFTIALGIALMAWAVRTFNAAGTNVDVRQPSTTVVSDGPYGYSRNPIYVAMGLIVLGAAIWLNSLWILFSLVIILPTIEAGVIRREEGYLEKKFGQKYLDYKSKVRRWV